MSVEIANSVDFFDILAHRIENIESRKSVSIIEMAGTWSLSPPKASSRQSSPCLSTQVSKLISFTIVATRPESLDCTNHGNPQRTEFHISSDHKMQFNLCLNEQ